MAIFNLKVEARDNLQKSHTKQLRKEGLVPGIYYYHGAEPKTIAVNKRELLAAIKTNAHIFQLEAGKDVLQTIIKTIQWHPVTDEPIHIDFLGVNEKEAIEVSVRIETEGIAVGVKEHGGLLSQSVWHLTVKCFVKDIPEQITINVEELGMGDSIAVKDLSLENIGIMDSPAKSLVSVIQPKGASADDDEVEDGEEGEEEEGTEDSDEKA